MRHGIENTAHDHSILIVIQLFVPDSLIAHGIFRLGRPGRPGGLVAWWPGGLVAWWPGGLVAWWPGGLVGQAVVTTFPIRKYLGGELLGSKNGMKLIRKGLGTQGSAKNVLIIDIEVHCVH